MPNITFGSGINAMDISTGEAKEIGIDNGEGYYTVLTMCFWNAEKIMQGTQIAIGYFGTSKRYIRTFANYEATNNWVEF